MLTFTHDGGNFDKGFCGTIKDIVVAEALSLVTSNGDFRRVANGLSFQEGLQSPIMYKPQGDILRLTP